MRILGIRSLDGPNVFHHKPVLVMDLDLEELTEIASSEISGFTERLLDYLPGLADHKCSPGRPGGFVERLQKGTYFGHIVEHIALELSRNTEIEVSFGKTIYGGKPGLYQVIVRQKSREGMSALLKTSVAVAEAASRGEAAFPLEEERRRIEKIISDSGFGPSTKAILDAADRRGIPWVRLNHLNLLQLGYGKHRKLIQATTSSLTSDIAVDIAQDKTLTKKILAAASLPVAPGEEVSTEEEMLEASQRIGIPLAIKPVDGNHGRGVFLHLTSSDELRLAYREASALSQRVLLEKSLIGKDYRVLVVEGKMVAACERIPAHVKGDGLSSIRELIQKENENPLRGEGHAKPLTKIEIDPCLERCLRKAGLHLDTIPEKESIIFLRETANLSAGGTAADVTSRVDPEVKELCERAARIIGLDICGIDIIAENISRSPHGQNFSFVEVNAGPGIRMHHFPAIGEPQDAAGAILDSLFPKNGNGRIPLCAITGTNGKTTVTRIVSHILEGAGKAVGTTTTDGIYLRGQQIAQGDTTGPLSAQALLCDPAVEVAVLETARGGIMRRGLGFDWCDVGVITNIHLDHIGQDGIETPEDILRIKSLVVERVREGGVAVLNGDDELLVRLANSEILRKRSREVVLFSTEESLPLRRHRREGGTCYFQRDGWLWECRGLAESKLLALSELSFAFGGQARFQVANALAAAAAARALGVPAALVAQGLQSFVGEKNNLGRTNLFRAENGFVLLDYGHNPQALAAVAALAGNLAPRRTIAVIAAPGDRSDELIRELGHAAARGFDQLWIREDQDLRGRGSGEVANLLLEAVKAVNPKAPVALELCPLQSLRKALSCLKQGELLVYFYEELNPILSELQLHGCLPMDIPYELGNSMALDSSREVS